jgi:hypothetical protein
MPRIHLHYLVCHFASAQVETEPNVYITVSTHFLKIIGLRSELERNTAFLKPSSVTFDFFYCGPCLVLTSTSHPIQTTYAFIVTHVGCTRVDIFGNYEITERRACGTHWGGKVLIGAGDWT